MQNKTPFFKTKHFIIGSWVLVLFAIGLATPYLTGFGSSEKPKLIFGILFVLGYGLLVVPNAIWIIRANKIASQALSKNPSIFINGLAVYFVIAFAGIWSLFTLPIYFDQQDAQEETLFSLLNILAPTAFGTLIASCFMVSRRFIQAEIASKTRFRSSMFLTALCFYIIMIGMFFLSRRLTDLSRGEPILQA